MSTEPTTHSYLDLVGEVMPWLAGGGILTVALFPLALPLILLTVAAAIPLLLLGLPVALVAGLIVVPLRLARRALRARRARRDRAGHGPNDHRSDRASVRAHPKNRRQRNALLDH
jgi:membrane protein implicated in regulation of membrane protease activity